MIILPSVKTKKCFGLSLGFTVRRGFLKFGVIGLARIAPRGHRRDPLSRTSIRRSQFVSVASPSSSGTVAGVNSNPLTHS